MRIPKQHSLLAFALKKHYSTVKFIKERQLTKIWYVNITIIDFPSIRCESNLVSYWVDSNVSSYLLETCWVQIQCPLTYDQSSNKMKLMFSAYISG